MKLPYKLLLTGVVGVTGGYFAAPYLLPPILSSIYGSTAESQPVSAATEPIVGESDSSAGVSEKKDSDTAIAVTEKKIDTDGINSLDPGEEDPDAFTDAEDTEEFEDEEDDDIRPRRIASYRRSGEDDGRRPVNEQHFVSKLTPSSWKQPKTLERRLASRIRSRMKGTSQEKVEVLLKDPEVRLMLAQWELLHRSDLDALGKLMSDRETCNDLAKLLNDLKWVSSFVYDGELTKPEVALSMIRHFRQIDPNMDAEALKDGGDGSQPGLKRRVAAAIAVEFTRNGWYGEERELTKEELESFKDLGVMLPTLPGDKKSNRNKKDLYRAARERYLFFAESIDQDKLNTYFATLPDWLLHFPCGWKGNSAFGTASTMRWLRDNCSVRAMEYTAMCSHVPYLPTNVYGDSIFSPLYYEPFNAIYPGNFAKETRDVGAVCGGLSHFGTSSACANGVPAITMGEPGHCAYAVYAEGKWHPANSLFDKHNPHWSVWGEYTWSAFQMMTSMYQQGALTRDAQMVCTLASVLAAHKNPVNALKLYELSVQMQPLNHPVWSYYIDTAAKSLSRSPRKWLGVNEFVCSSITPEHPEMCSKFLTENIYPFMLKTLRSPRQKLAAFEAYFKNINQNETTTQWDMESMLDMQYQSLGKSRNVKMDFLRSIVENVSKHPTFGLAVTWAIKAAAAENKKMGKDVVDLVRKSLDSAENKDLMAAAVIRAAEEMGDFDLADEWSEPYLEGKGGMPDFEPAGGNIVSRGGLVHLAKCAEDQSYFVHHAAALSGAGGHIKSEAGKHQTVIVELPKPARIGGVVIVPTNGAASYRSWQMDVSSDGKTWKTLAELPDSRPDKFIRVCIKQNQPTAKFIRIDSGEDQNVGIDFKGILVYDNKKVK